MNARYSMMVAMTPQRVIGAGNQLPWHMPADLKYFKDTTKGHAVIMGRKTYDSVGRPLPGRLNIVVTRGSGEAFHPDVLKAASLEQALELVTKHKSDDLEPFILGGATIYDEALRLDAAATAPGFLKRLYVTIIETTVLGDAYFPEIDGALWRCVSERRFEADEKNPHAYRFLIYEKAKTVR